MPKPHCQVSLGSLLALWLPGPAQRPSSLEIRRTELVAFLLAGSLSISHSPRVRRGGEEAKDWDREVGHGAHPCPLHPMSLHLTVGRRSHERRSGVLEERLSWDPSWLLEALEKNCRSFKKLTNAMCSFKLPIKVIYTHTLLTLETAICVCNFKK